MPHAAGAALSAVDRPGAPRAVARPRLHAPAERAFLIAALGAHAILRLLYVFHHEINSDEPQHLHVAWAWTSGLLPYRDVFDNHAPLFGMLSAPLVAALGERADILILMRIAMLPLVALTLWATWLIARRAAAPALAPWAVALAALSPGFLRVSVEYRADVLWMTAWLLALAVLVSGRLTAARAAFAGLLLGVAVGVSMKSILLLASLAVAAGMTLALLARAGSKPPPRRVAGVIAALAAGTLAVPLAIAVTFAALGAWRPFVYCIGTHNLLPEFGTWRALPWRFALVPLALPLLWFGGRLAMRTAPTPADGARRALLWLVTGIYFVSLNAVWPLITRQDYLPVTPLIAVLLAALTPVFAIAARGIRSRLAFAPSLAWLAPAALVVIETVSVMRAEPPWRDGTSAQSALLADVLQLTRPGDSVMDLKGETVFRPRPFYFALEGITRARIATGRLPDDIAERMIAAHTPVAFADDDNFPLRARAFMNANYMRAGNLRVLGKMLLPARDDRDPRRRFVVVVPQRYAVVSDRGAASGLLDGTAYAGPRMLAAGLHVFTPPARDGLLAVVWASAIERGFSPFAGNEGI
jgi:hypothetical protein